jgi:hypothetical protein
VYADITSETVALDTDNNVAVFVTDGSAECAPTVCPYSKSDFPVLSHGLSLSAITNALTRALQSVNKWKNKFSVLPSEVLSV